MVSIHRELHNRFYTNCPHGLVQSSLFPVIISTLWYFLQSPLNLAKSHFFERIWKNILHQFISPSMAHYTFI